MPMQKADLAVLNADELRHFAASVVGLLDAQRSALEQKDAVIASQATLLQKKDSEIQHKDLKISQLTHEMAILKRWRFGRASEAFHGLQREIFEESIDEDFAAVEIELDQLRLSPKGGQKKAPSRNPLPPHLPRIDIPHEPENTVCGCGCQMKRVGEDVSEKVDYVPGTFQVERHVRGKWVCRQCDTIMQAPVAPHVIDKGLPTTRLLAVVLISKYLDHLPLHRQSEIYARLGVNLATSTLAEWVGACGVKLQPLIDALKARLLKRSVMHADETPMPTLQPGLGKTHRSYLWAYGTTSYDPDPIVVYDFSAGRSGEHARAFLSGWAGHLVCDDFSGYKKLFKLPEPMTEVGCLAHARRKFADILANQKTSTLAPEALEYYGALYAVERKAKDLGLDAEGRRALRQAEAVPVANALHAWLTMRLKAAVPNSATAKAINYSLRRWEALTRYLGDGELPIDNNWIENRIRPLALGRKSWLFAGSDRAGRRATAVMSLLQTAKMHGLDPYAYLADVLERLPGMPASRIEELLPDAWKATHPVN